MLQNINKSTVTKTAALALIAAVSVSFVALSNANTTYQLTVNVSDECGPVIGAQATIVNGPDDGAFGITNQAGTFTFNNLSAGVFYIHAAAADHVSQDSNSIVLDRNQTVNFTLTRTNGGCEPLPPPTCTITANPAAIVAGTSSTLSWTSTNATSASLNQGIGNVSLSGTRIVSPAVTTTYTLSVAGAGGSATCSAPVVVNQPVENFYNLTVNVRDVCGPIVAQVTIVNGPDDGAFGITNNSGQFIFNNLNAGVFYLRVVSANHIPKDTGTIVLNSNQTVNVVLDRTNGPCNLPVIGTITVSKQVRNQTQNQSTFVETTAANPSDIVEFKIAVPANNGAVSSVVVSDILPAKLSYVGGSLRIDNVINGNSLTNISLGDLSAGQTKTILFRALVAQTSEFGFGTTTLTNTANVNSQSNSASDTASVTVTKDQLPQGFLDVADCNIIAGWAKDPDNELAQTVKIYRDGDFNTGTLISTLIADQNRADVGAHAFQIATPSVLRDGNSHQVYAYVMSGSSHILLNNSPKNVVCPISGQVNVSKTVRNLTQGQMIFTDSIAAGGADQVEFKIVVGANAGFVNNIILSDILPNKLTYVSNSLRINAVSVGNSLNQINLNNLTNGQSKLVTFQASVAASSAFAVGTTVLTNTANVVSDQNSDSDTASVSVTISQEPHAQLFIDKMAKNITQGQNVYDSTIVANPGDQISFKISVTASGNTSAQNVVVTDVLPANFSLVSGNITFNLGSVPVGTTETVTLVAQVAQASNFACGENPRTNTATATASNTSTVLDSVGIIINKTEGCGGISPLLSVVKLSRNLTAGQTVFTDNISANPGDQVQFQIQVSTSGNTTAQNVVVTDTLPANFSLSSGSLVNNLGNMTAGSVQTVTLTANIASDSNFDCGSTTRTNTVQATATNSNSATDTTNVVVLRSNGCGGGGSNFVTLSFTKEVRNISTNTSFANTVNASNNDRVQFKLVVRNNNVSTAANNVRITDTLPSGLTYIPGSFFVDFGSASGNLFSGGENLGNLSAGQSRTITFDAQVIASTTQTLVNQALVTADNAFSTSASASVFVQGVVAGTNIDLVLFKKAFNRTQNVDATTVVAKPNDVIAYTLTVENRGNGATSNYVFQDNIEDILQLAQLEDFGGAEFLLGQYLLKWQPVTIGAFSKVEKTFTVTVRSSFPQGSDNIMTNFFGNTVNVTVNKPAVAGVFIAPKTGSTATLSFGLAVLSVLGFAVYRKREQLKLFWQKIV